MQKLNPLENLKQYRVAKSATRLGSHATAKALASLTKVGKKQLEELVISAHLWRR
jgi:hypothetical protein